MNKRKCYLFHEKNIPRRAKFPVVDAHNHLWGQWDKVDEIIAVMDELGVVSYCDLTADMTVEWGDGGYVFHQEDINRFLENCPAKYPGRFYGFTVAGFAKPVAEPLFTDHKKFVEESIELLNRRVEQGVRGLKVLKELGLHWRDGSGKLIPVDDERLFPIWEEAGKLGIPVLIHQSDPYGFFEPVTPENEHYENLKKYTSWSFADPKFPRKKELLERRDNLVRQHPNTTFILPHVGNFVENLAYVSEMLDSLPNACIDISARIDELGRQPYTSREFLIKYQDRVLFGTDMPVTREIYRCYFRFLETFDEYFDYPDYDGTFGGSRWMICGVGLPDDVLKKIYHGNALKIIPGLMEDVKNKI